MIDILESEAKSKEKGIKYLESLIDGLIIFME